MGQKYSFWGSFTIIFVSSAVSQRNVNRKQGDVKKAMLRKLNYNLSAKIVMTMTVIGGGIVLTEESVLMMSTVFTKRSASPSHLCICVCRFICVMYLC